MAWISGLKLTRNGTKFTATWKATSLGNNKVREYNAKWEISYVKSVNGGNWCKKTYVQAVKSSKTSTTLDISIPAIFKTRNLHPKGLNGEIQTAEAIVTSVTFSLKATIYHSISTGGSSVYGTSGWLTATFPLYSYTQGHVSMSKASMKASVDSTLSNKVNFTISQTAKDSQNRCPWTDCYYEIYKANNWNGSALNMCQSKYIKSKGRFTGASSSPSYVVDAVKTGTSQTVVLRAHRRGYAGDSDWTYDSHVFAIPQQPSLSSGEQSRCYFKRIGSRYNLYVEGTAQSSREYPVDKVNILYLITTPDDAMECPQGASWTTLDTIKGNKVATGNWVDKGVEENQCVYVRIESVHDTFSNQSEPYLLYKGELSKPTLSNSISIDTKTSSCTLTATNNAKDVPDSFIQLFIRYSKDGEWYHLGDVAHDDSGEELTFTHEGIATCYGIYQIRACAVVYTEGKGILWQSGYTNSTMKNFPVAPQNLKAILLTDGTTAQLSWDWVWNDATGAKISWSDHEDAWYSTDEPSSYELEDVVEQFNVSDLDSKTYYFRVRFIDQSGDKDVYSPWSDIVSLDIASTPTAPTLAIQNSAIPFDGGEVTCTVGYGGTGAITVQLAEYKNNAVVTKTDGIPLLLTTSSNSQITLTIEEINQKYADLGMSDYQWKTGETHTLIAQAVSDGGATSDLWSNTATVKLVDLPTIEMTTNLVEEEIVDDPDNPDDKRTVNVLKVLPFNVSMSCDTNATCKAVIERAEDYNLTRPNEKTEERYEGESIYSATDTRTDEITSCSFEITADGLTGYLDDGVQYNIIGTVTDTYGQTATQNVPFEVHWAHQPEIPTVAVETLKDDLATKITVTKPTSYEDGDCFDVYRLSADKPELVLSDCEYGTAYVDPYPTFGEFGGHRIVNKTANGDYITSDNEFAWTDTGKDAGDYVDNKEIIVDFNGQRINLPYGISLSNSWSKDFTRTTYLGGSVAGDWNPAVTRDLSASTTVLAVIDPDTIKAMRALASYAGICHVRTPEGSSFACDIQVSESREGSTQKVVSFSLTIKQVDTEGFDGMTYEQWKKESE